MITMAMTSIVAPKALPTFKVSGVMTRPSRLMLRRKSWAIVTPNCAYAEAVRMYARKVRSSAMSRNVRVGALLLVPAEEIR